MTVIEMMHRVVVAALIAGCVQTSPTARAKAAASASKGERRPLRVDMNVHQLGDSTLAALRASHVAAIRTTLYWASNPVGSERLERWVREVKRAKAAGYDVLVVVHQEPAARRGDAWAARVDAFAEYLTTVAPLVPGTAWQLFNEVDSNSFDDLFTTVSGATPAVLAAEVQQSAGRQYGTFLGMVIPRLRTADRTARVVTAGVGLAPGIFLTEVRRALPSGAMPDAIAVHAYGYPLSRLFTRNFAEARGAFPELPIWATEFGMNGGQVPGAHTRAEYDLIQQQEIADAIDADPGYARAYLYVLWTGEDVEFPIFRRDWSARPAAAWVAAHNAALP
jgi:Glycosyl hydrolase catalytic core